jgi:hypothetical protein
MSKPAALAGAVALAGLLAVLAVTLKPTSGEAGRLYPVRIGGRWGYIDPAGKMVTKPQYDRAEPFSDGMGRVTATVPGKGDRIGYVDSRGKEVIAPRFLMAGDFAEGVAHAALQYGKFGYIDQRGQFTIEPQFNTAWPFSEGVATVLPGKAGALRIIDRAGGTLASVEADRVTPMREGVACVYRGNMSWSIDARGRKLADVRGACGSQFGSGLIPVWPDAVWTKGHRNLGYADRTGKVIIAPKYDQADDFREGLAAVGSGIWTPGGKGGKWGYIDPTGREVIPVRFPDPPAPGVRGIGPFSEGLAWAGDGKKIGYIDRTGKFAIQPQFEDAHPFQGELALVVLGGKQAYVNKAGKVVWRGE